MQQFVQVRFDGEKDGDVGILISSNDETTVVRMETGTMTFPTNEAILVNTKKPTDWGVKLSHADLVAPTPKQPTEKAPKVGSKLEQAIALYQANPTLSRKEMIELYVAEIGMTPAGASTYYSNAKKQIG